MITRANNPILHFDDAQGHPLAGGLLCTFVAGTSTPVKTYKDESGTFNETQVRLDSRGEAAVFLDSSVSYKFVVLDRDGALVISADNVTSNTRTFTADGTNGITVQEEVVDGRTVLHFGIADNSITKDKLHNPRELIVDAETMEMVAKDIGGRKYVVLKSKGGAGGVTQEYVDEAIEQDSEQRQTAISQVSQMIPTKTSQLQNDSGFLRVRKILLYNGTDTYESKKVINLAESLDNFDFVEFHFSGNSDINRICAISIATQQANGRNFTLRDFHVNENGNLFFENFAVLQNDKTSLTYKYCKVKNVFENNWLSSGDQVMFTIYRICGIKFL